MEENITLNLKIRKCSVSIYSLVGLVFPKLARNTFENSIV